MVRVFKNIELLNNLTLTCRLKLMTHNINEGARKFYKLHFEPPITLPPIKPSFETLEVKVEFLNSSDASIPSIPMIIVRAILCNILCNYNGPIISSLTPDDYFCTEDNLNRSNQTKTGSKAKV